MRQLALDIAKISCGGQIFPQSDSMLKKLSHQQTPWTQMGTNGEGKKGKEEENGE